MPCEHSRQARLPIVWVRHSARTAALRDGGPGAAAAPGAAPPASPPGQLAHFSAPSAARAEGLSKSGWSISVLPDASQMSL